MDDRAQPSDPAAEDKDLASRLCLSCGLCCNGGLYGHVKLDDDDRSRLAAIGAAAPDKLLHPCCHYAGGPCAIYDDRPKTCRTYRCRLLEAFSAAEIDFGTASARVAQALDLREGMDAAAPDGLTPQQAAQEWVADVPGGRTPARSRSILGYVAYWTYAERHFLKENDTRVNRVKI